MAPEIPTATYKFRRDDLSGLTDLELIGHEAGIHSGPRRADGGSEFISNRFDKLEVFTVLHAAAAGNHHPRGGQFGPLALGQFGGDEFGQAGHARRHVTGFGRGAATLGGNGSKLAARTVMIFLVSDDFTVAMPLPA